MPSNINTADGGETYWDVWAAAVVRERASERAAAAAPSYKQRILSPSHTLR